MSPTAENASPPLRADARRNRALILEAAEASFAAEGLGVPVDEIARRAGVGAGTLYRHFPTKEDLFEAVVVAHIEHMAEQAEALAESADPTAALFDFITDLASQSMTKKNLMEALAGSDFDPKAKAKDALDRVEAAMTVLVKRAQEAGTIRLDVTPDDLLGLVMGTCMHQATDEHSQTRMLSIICAGLRCEK